MLDIIMNYILPLGKINGLDKEQMVRNRRRVSKTRGYENQISYAQKFPLQLYTFHLLGLVT